MRWKCVCSYDGTNYSGWQSQNGQSSVQAALQNGFEQVFKERVSVHGSGRTDAGVHALGQVFHFDWEWRHSGDSLLRALFTKLPRDIRILSAVREEDDFHARFSAKTKRYRYRLHLGTAPLFEWKYCWSVASSLDLNQVDDAMKLFVGEHDFAGFAANRGIEYESTVRRVTAAKISQKGNFIDLSFEANGFMYKMARSLAGTLMNVGLDRMDIEDLRAIMETGERTPQVLVAPAQGLFLEKVFY